MNYAEKNLSDLALSIPMATQLFRKNRLDYCCGGTKTLRLACGEKGINVDEMIHSLEKLASTRPATEADLPLPELTKHIVKRYHEDLRTRFPELVSLAEKVERVHREHQNCPHGLAELLKGMHREMLEHMLKEERILFPMIEQGKGKMAQMPMLVMTMEHDSHAKRLEQLHQLTSDFRAPEGACTTWQALYLGLDKLEEELMDHINLENNVLFPRALNS